MRFILFLCVLLSFQAIGFSQSELETIVARLRTVSREVLSGDDSFYFRTELTESKDIEQTTLSGGMLRMEWVTARRGSSDWYSSVRYLDKITSKGMQLNQDPQICIVSNGLIVDWLGDGTCLVDKFENNFNPTRSWDYFQFLGLGNHHIVSRDWSKAKIDSIHSNSVAKWNLDEPFFPDSLEGGSKYQLKDDLEQVNGHACFRLEWSEMDTIWVDAKLFAIRKRQLHWGENLPLKYVVEADDFRELKAGIWLPFKLTVDRYAAITYEPKNFWGKLACRSTYVAKEMEFGKNVDDLFDFKLKEGSFVSDNFRKIEYVVRKTGNPLEDGLGKASLELQNAHSVWITVLLASIALILTVWVFNRRRTTFLFGGLLISIYSSTGQCSNCLDERSVEYDTTCIAEVESGDSETFDWIPEWRSSADCGPNALYSLMRLSGIAIDFQSIRGLIVNRDNGCSLQDLSNVSRSLGLPTEVRFVKPTDFRYLKFPVILHGMKGSKAGHFVTIVSYDSGSKSYGILDPVNDDFSHFPEDRLFLGYSGYVLIAEQGFEAVHIINYCLLALIAGLLLFAYRTSQNRWQRNSNQ